MSNLVAYRWTGDSMEPLPRFRKECDRDFVIGEIYTLEPLEERSGQSHRHYFAAIKDAWANLPEELSGEYPTPEHFRKRLLIEAGFCDEQKTVFSNPSDAIKAAAIILERDDYVVAEAKGRVLTVWTAKSQSMRAMDKATFQDSKDKTLEIAANMIGTTAAELSKAEAA